jgi:uncharacterized protein (TIGR03437 family)
MKVIILGAFLVSGVAFGQTRIPPTSALAEVTCTSSAISALPNVRGEGTTELLPDLVFRCTGGTPTAAGTRVPSASFKILLNTAVTSQLIGNKSEALLLIDEPKPGAQLGCAASCAVDGDGTGSSTYNGLAGHFNIFQGTQDGPNSLVFNDVPFDPPGANSLVLRFVNLRGNANQLGFSGLEAQITASTSLSCPSAAFNFSQVVANVKPSVAYGATALSGFFCAQDGSSIYTQNPDGSMGSSPPAAVLQYLENYPGSFKVKGSPISVPGASYSGESAFGPIAGWSPLIGQAGFGTRLVETVTGIPAGFTLNLPASGNLTDINKDILGTWGASSPGYTVTANTLSLRGNATVAYEILTRTPGSLAAGFSVPHTLSGTAAAVQTPNYFRASVGYDNSPYTVTTLWGPGSSLLPSYPAFSSLDSAVSAPPLYSSFLLGTVMGDCVNAGVGVAFDHPAPQTSAATGTLSTTGTPSPAFINVIGAGNGTTAGPNLIAPRISNVEVVSVLSPTSNVTVTANPPAPWLNVGLSGTTTPLTAFLSVNNAAVGKYSTSLNFSAPGGVSLSVPVTYAVTNGPWFARYGFANSASYVSDVVAPGEPFVIFGGDSFGPATLAGPALNANGLVATTIGNTQVLFDGTPAPLYYSVDANGTGQIAGFAPFELATKTSTNVQVIYNGVASPPVTIPVLDAVPGLYTADSSGGGQGAILNHDLTVNSDKNREAVGNLVVLYGGGGGQTSPPGRDGGLAGMGAALGKLVLPVQVFIDGIAATNISYAGPAPGLVEGVFQINVTIPAGVRSHANVPVVVQVEDKQTQPGVTLATK